MSSQEASIAIPSFRLLCEDQATPGLAKRVKKLKKMFATQAASSNEDDEDSSDEHYARLHAPQEEKEQEAYVAYIRSLERREKYANNRRTSNKKIYVQCSLCKKWHIVPKKSLLKEINPATWTCFDNIWDTLAFDEKDKKNKRSCINRRLLIKITSEADEEKDLFVQCCKCKKWHLVPPSVGLTEEDLEAITAWECSDNTWDSTNTSCTTTKKSTQRKK